VLSVFGRGVCPWLALARSFVAGFLFLFSLGLSVVLPVTARESQSGAIVVVTRLVRTLFLALFDLRIWGVAEVLPPFVCRSDVVALGLLSPFLIKMWGLAVAVVVSPSSRVLVMV
ncbi:unnamed protein product, partial [Brassica napus]